MAVETLHGHLVDELQDLLDAETQLTKALPKLARAATAKKLGDAFRRHLVETRGHVARLTTALQKLGEKPSRKTCEGMEGLLTEGETLMNETPQGALRDAVMIASAQKVEHYEMASYGTARTYAQVLGKTSVARLLAQTLKEEKAADLKLTTIAEGSVNARAAEAWQSRDDEGGGMAGRSAAWVSEVVGSAKRQLSGGVKRAAASVGLSRKRSSKRRGSRRRSATRKRVSGRR